MEFKGTKGKWNPKQNPILKNEMYVDSEYSIICNLNDANFHTELEMEANALLISKAPEMLEMLINWVNQYDGYGDFLTAELLKKTRQLVKEATKNN